MEYGLLSPRKQSPQHLASEPCSGPASPRAWPARLPSPFPQERPVPGCLRALQPAPPTATRNWPWLRRCRLLQMLRAEEPLPAQGPSRPPHRGASSTPSPRSAPPGETAASWALGGAVSHPGISPGFPRSTARQWLFLSSPVAPSLSHWLPPSFAKVRPQTLPSSPGALKSPRALLRCQILCHTGSLRGSTLPIQLYF